MVKEDRSRTREPEPEPMIDYAQHAYEEFHKVQHRADNPYVIKNGDRPWQDGIQGRVKFYSGPIFDDAVLPGWFVFKEEQREKSGRHTHQGGLSLFATKGEGESFIKDERVPWEKGDLVILPIVPGGIEHQHFNRNDPDNPSEWLAHIWMPHIERLGAGLTQNDYFEHAETHGEDWTADHEHEEVSQEFMDFEYSDWLDYELPAETETFYDDLIIERNQFRKSMAESQEAGNYKIIKGEDITYEWNPQGKIKWYLHPSRENVSVRNILFSVQEIPPGSRSGKQLRQGGVAHYIWEGMGHSIIDGDRYEWEKGDYLAFPVKPEGISIQHFNDDPENPARFTRCEPYNKHLGFDLGSGFKQLESCPEYE